MRPIIPLLAGALLLGACAEGRYRLPYETGETVFVESNHDTHDSPVGDMYDLQGQSAAPRIVASAGGWVRYHKDTNAGVGTGNNNFLWLEHPEPYCQDPADPMRSDWPGRPPLYGLTCKTCPHGFGQCNEYTFYAHMIAGSVTGTRAGQAGLTGDAWVNAGQFIGIEGQIGTADFKHLHWAVMQVPPTWFPDSDGDYGHHLDGGPRREVRPLVCTADGLRLLLDDQSYGAVPCPSRGLGTESG